VVMHEVGHSLGLRHNFKASTMLPYEQVNDTSITHVKGMTGSVMDYNPINIAPKGKKQGDFASTTIGPYDYWAIEFAYKPIEGDEAAELKKIAARSPEPDLTFGTDEDMMLDDDPLINTYDLGSDPMKFGQERIQLAADLLKDLDQKVVKDGESWARLRSAFSTLVSQYGNATYLAANFVGGQYVCRDFKGGEKSHDPVTPVPGDKQREALKFLTVNVLGDKAFTFSPALLRRLTTEYWDHWGSDSMFMSGGIDYPIFGRILALQRIALNQCFSPTILSRIQHQQLQSDAGAKPLKMEEIFSTLTESIWSELDGNTASFSTVRRNLQREHLRRLMTMVVGTRSSSYGDMYGFVVFLGSSSVPADAKSLARLHLTEISNRIAKLLETKSGAVDNTTRAHLVECRQRITKTLDSSYTANEL
jgi:hypothetical protein